MSRGRSVEERRKEAGAARSLLADLPVEPISVRIVTAVKLTGIPRSTLYELIGSGELQTKKIGRSTFILYSSLKRLLEVH